MARINAILNCNYKLQNSSKVIALDLLSYDFVDFVHNVSSRLVNGISEIPEVNCTLLSLSEEEYKSRMIYNALIHCRPSSTPKITLKTMEHRSLPEGSNLYQIFFKHFHRYLVFTKHSCMF